MVKTSACTFAHLLDRLREPCSTVTAVASFDDHDESTGRKNGRVTELKISDNIEGSFCVVANGGTELRYDKT